jgi:putative membrane protein
MHVTVTLSYPIDKYHRPGARRIYQQSRRQCCAAPEYARRCDDLAMTPTLSARSLALYSATVIALLALSGYKPFDLATWLMEVAPVAIVLIVLWVSHRRFPLTPLLYALIFIHAVVLMLGGHYSYARVPLGDWLRGWLHLSRNPYDGIGHFAQGFIPAIAARELLLRQSGLRRGGWLFAVVVLACLGVSALYELIEWGAAVALGQGAEEFLGTQGDPWDTQKDMALAGVGAVVALLTLSRWHDRQLSRLPPRPPAASR